MSDTMKTENHTDIELAFYFAFAFFSVVCLDFIVLRHDGVEFACQSGLLRLPYPQVCCHRTGQVFLDTFFYI